MNQIAGNTNKGVKRKSLREHQHTAVNRHSVRRSFELPFIIVKKKPLTNNYVY